MAVNVVNGDQDQVTLLNGRIANFRGFVCSPHSKWHRRIESHCFFDHRQRIRQVRQVAGLNGMTERIDFGADFCQYSWIFIERVPGPGESESRGFMSGTIDASHSPATLTASAYHANCLLRSFDAGT